MSRDYHAYRIHTTRAGTNGPVTLTVQIGTSDHGKAYASYVDGHEPALYLTRHAAAQILAWWRHQGHIIWRVHW